MLTSPASRQGQSDTHIAGCNGHWTKDTVPGESSYPDSGSYTALSPVAPTSIGASEPGHVNTQGHETARNQRMEGKPAVIIATAGLATIMALSIPLAFPLSLPAGDIRNSAQLPLWPLLLVSLATIVMLAIALAVWSLLLSRATKRRPPGRDLLDPVSVGSFPSSWMAPCCLDAEPAPPQQEKHQHKEVLQPPKPQQQPQLQQLGSDLAGALEGAATGSAFVAEAVEESYGVLTAPTSPFTTQDVAVALQETYGRPPGPDAADEVPLAIDGDSVTAGGVCGSGSSSNGGDLRRTAWTLFGWYVGSGGGRHDDGDGEGSCSRVQSLRSWGDRRASTCNQMDAGGSGDRPAVGSSPQSQPPPVSPSPAARVYVATDPCTGAVQPHPPSLISASSIYELSNAAGASAAIAAGACSHMATAGITDTSALTDGAASVAAARPSSVALADGGASAAAAANNFPRSLSLWAQSYLSRLWRVALPGIHLLSRPHRQTSHQPSHPNLAVLATLHQRFGHTISDGAAFLLGHGINNSVDSVEGRSALNAATADQVATQGLLLPSSNSTSQQLGVSNSIVGLVMGIQSVCRSVFGLLLIHHWQEVGGLASGGSQSQLRGSSSWVVNMVRNAVCLP